MGVSEEHSKCTVDRYQTYENEKAVQSVGLLGIAVGPAVSLPVQRFPQLVHFGKAVER